MPDRTVIVMRHAKSDWGDPALPDFDRTLSARGLAAAPAMGRWLVLARYLPERIVCSPARRALDTARLVKAELDPVATVDLVTDRRIYEASPDDLLAVIRDHSMATLMVIGHNPGIEQVLGILLHQNPAAEPIGAVPTGAIFVLRNSAPFVTADTAARLVARMTPRELPRSLLRS
jgi:phosphohistidine phosphatase